MLRLSVYNQVPLSCEELENVTNVFSVSPLTLGKNISSSYNGKGCYQYFLCLPLKVLMLRSTSQAFNPPETSSQFKLLFVEKRVFLLIKKS